MKRLIVFSVLFSSLLFLVASLGAQVQQLESEDLLELAREGRLQQVTAQGLQFAGSFQGPDSQQRQTFQVVVANAQEMQSLALELDQLGVEVEIRPDDEGLLMWVLVGVAALGALVGGLWFAFLH